MQTYVSTKLIQKYFQARAGKKFAGIVTQVDTAAQMMARILGADFVAVFYCGQGELIPVSYQHGHHLSIRNLGALESYWANKRSDLLPHESIMIDLEEDDSASTLPPDQFGRDNSFACNYQFRYDFDGDLDLICSAYWYESQPAVSLESIHMLDLACQSASIAMNAADDLAQVENYSQGLSRLLPLFELPLRTLAYDELVDQVLQRVNDIIPGAIVLALQRDNDTGSFTLKEHINCDRPTDEDLKLMLEQVEPLIRLDLQEDTLKYRCQNLGRDSDTYWSHAVMLEISPDSDIHLVLVVKAAGNIELSANDRELLSVLAVFVQTVLRNALLVKQLREANQLLDEASQRLANTETVAALADMTSGLAHDFNNVFGGLIGRVQLMKRKTEDGANLEGLNQLEHLALVGAESVRRLQEFSTSVTQRKLYPVELGQLLKDLMAVGRITWQEIAAGKKIQVCARCLLDKVVVSGDRVDLMTVIDKLVDNAVKFSPNGSKVDIIVAAEENLITITVSDEGPGIPEQLRTKIFYPFFTTTLERGAGLGLAIVRGIVGRLNGNVAVHSNESGGSSFVVTLEGIEESPRKVVRETTLSKNKPERLRILVVDDDSDVREVLMDTLAIDGHNPVGCPDGYVALEEIDKRDFNMMITDLGMPGMSGLELAGIVHERFPAMPIAMITGWGTQLDESELALSGIRTIMSKPFHLKDVRALVSDLSAEAQSSDQIFPRN
ncbi:MAG: response regulator [candidate division Zixibacteria bacterium]|nr:response regulator [candidate division Zixibacteria bacterium]